MKNKIQISMQGMAMACMAFSASYAYGQDRPNILWLTYEDTSPQYIGCYGDTHAKTPNIDKLAKEGVRFTSAFSTAAVSSASRCCIFTGIPATSLGTGNHRSAYPIPEGIEGFPYYMRQAGYYTTNNSKTDYNIQNAKRYIKKAWHQCNGKADWRTREEGQPFFAIYNSMSSHQSRTMTYSWEKYEKTVLNRLNDESKTAETANFELPAYYRDSKEMRHHFSRVYNSIALSDQEFGHWIDKLKQDGELENTIIFCYADHGEGMPFGKACAAGMGFRVPFVVWFPEKYKHLSPWGTGGVVSDELISFEDLATTALSLAGVDIPKHMKGRNFLSGNKNTQRQYVFSAVDRTGENTDLSRSVTDGRYMYTRVFKPYQPFLRWNIYWDMSEIQQTIRCDFREGVLNTDQASILKPRVVEYLYDLQEDKWETHNLIAEASHQKRIAQMREALRAHLVEVKDVQFIPEYTYMENKDIIPFDLSRDKALYPIKEVLETAWLNGEGTSVIGQQLKALKHKNDLVQYWAAIGLYSQLDLSSKDLKKVKKALTKVTYPPTRAYLASTLYRNANDQEAKEVLVQLIQDEHPEVARTAMQTAMYLHEKQQLEILPVVKNVLATHKANKRKDTHNVDCFCKMFIHLFEEEFKLTY